MKNKGFTLVELLGVLTLIGVIALIAIPAVDSVIKKARQDMYESAKNTVITSTRSWLSDNKELFSENGDKVTVSLLDLKEQGYLDFDFRNPTTSTCVSNSTQVLVTKIKDDTHNTYNIELVDDLIDGTEEDCKAVAKTPALYLTGDNPLSVKLGTTVNDTFLKKDVVAKSVDGDNILANVIISGSVNTSIPGKYQITYSVSSNGVSKSISRVVKVIDDEAPVINGAVDLTFVKSDTMPDITSGVSVTDNSGETLTIKVVNNVDYTTPGEYYATYTATDKSGNTSSVQVTITITN